MPCDGGFYFGPSRSPPVIFDALKGFGGLGLLGGFFATFRPLDLFGAIFTPSADFYLSTLLPPGPRGVFPNIDCTKLHISILHIVLIVFAIPLYMHVCRVA